MSGLMTDRGGFPAGREPLYAQVMNRKRGAKR